MLGAAVTTGAALGAATVAQAEPKQLPIQNMKKTARNATVYHCDFGDAGRFSQQLRNINNHLAVYNNDPRALKIVIVAHSAGIKFFLRDLADTPWSQEQIDPQLVERMQTLSSHGVEVYLCKVTFSTLNLSHTKARPDEYITFVPSGIAAAAALQAQGFSYLKVG
jgi:intracellular sulfur oxidation DsrE/DsrF family protein